MRYTDKSKRIVHASFLMIVLGIVSGCATTKPGPYLPVSASPTLEDIANVVLLDEGLQDWIAVDRVKAEKLLDGRTKVVANIRNMQSSAITIQSQTVFKDDEGFSIGDDTAWQTIIFSPNESKTYDTTSMKTGANRYTIRIRHAQ